MIELLSVRVGKVAVIGTHNGREVRSAFVKHAVEGPTIEVHALGLTGDEQRESRLAQGRPLHGGVDKAVYAYPVEHLPAWRMELLREVGPGLVGENLSVSGVTEDDVRIGDVWAWGPVRLRVTEPRLPCYKLDLVLGRSLKRFMLDGNRTGWYLAVDRPGVAPVDGPVEVVERGAGPTVADVLHGVEP